MLTPIIFWGAGGHAKVLRELVERIGYKLVATFDNDLETPAPFPDVPLLYGRDGFEQWRRECGSQDVSGLVAIGGARGKDRLDLQAFFALHRISAPFVVHPSAFVAANAKLGKGTQVLALAAVCAEVQLGEACILNTHSSLDHECALGQGVHIAPGAVLAGCVTVGDFSLIGAGAVVLPRVNIGRQVIVGAGSVVTRDVPDNKVVFGNPARIRHDNTAD